MNILVTGANGFLGSHIVEKALKKGHQVTALVRKGSDTSNLDHLSGYEVKFIDYSSVDSIVGCLDELPNQDIFIHNAGLTKSYTFDRYLKVNVDLTKKLTEALKRSKHFKSGIKFAYVSSLAAIGPKGHNGPASNYGRSKLLAEKAIQDSGLSYLIFRPTGIYGERDVQFVPLIKAVKLGLYPAMTPKHHKMTLINAKDVAENIIECSIAHANVIVHLEDGQIYEHSDMKSILEGILNKKSFNLRVSRPIVKTVLYFSDIIDRSLNRTPKLSREHYSEISQDWDYDFSEERKSIPLTIDYPLKKGFEEAINYYQANQLI
ncbi:NAD-dependent epimerase/dehydratase family protein [Marinoscillum pacificum]|uniref:NAD-dependent epimerase/dehydratase family protein n=1 Tax=Marinoscillum pacificum TaxID=392723 RepID=UPI002157184D|nr:NAD-dependent epimerase/dehydratase family protein [Marinoscillum pacificum]